MLKVERTSSKELIKRMLFHEDIKHGLISGDNVYHDDRLFDLIYYILKNDDEDCGIAAFRYLSDDYYICDIGILKKFRGKIGFKFGKLILDLFYKEFKNAKLITRIEKTNKPSIVYAVYFGFKTTGDDGKYKFMVRI